MILWSCFILPAEHRKEGKRKASLSCDAQRAQKEEGGRRNTVVFSAELGPALGTPAVPHAHTASSLGSCPIFSPPPRLPHWLMEQFLAISGKACIMPFHNCLLKYVPSPCLGTSQRKNLNSFFKRDSGTYLTQDVCFICQSWCQAMSKNPGLKEKEKGRHCSSKEKAQGWEGVLNYYFTNDGGYTVRSPPTPTPTPTVAMPFY